MKLLAVPCSWCAAKVHRSRGRINEAEKFGWRTYCSQECKGESQKRGKAFRCSRTGCHAMFYRAPHDSRSASLYCSNACAAIVNNSRYPKRKAAQSKCTHCHQWFKGKRPFCSTECKYKSQTISGEEICRKIREFYKRHRRIPVKVEFRHYGAAQDRFGSWNRAIAAAGFTPNPVIFAKRYIAKDGHKCDSLAEKVIDDWLHKNKIRHERNKKYPRDRKLTVDFVTRRHWIEFFGLAGEFTNYDALIKRKKKLAKMYKLPLLAIYPKDLFPKNRLPEILKIQSEQTLGPHPRAPI